MTAAAAGVAALLALADQRLPSGGHVHSGGVEQAIADGLVTDAATLRAFLRPAAAHRRAGSPPGSPRQPSALTAGAGRAQLDAEADARTPSPAQRAASRAQGRGLLRTGPGRVGGAARRTWPGSTSARARTTRSCSAAPPAPPGLAPGEAALVAAYLAVTGPATAAQRLLAPRPGRRSPSRPLELGADVDAVAARRRCRRGGPLADLPDDGDPLLDLLAERHAARGDRLFAS